MDEVENLSIMRAMSKPCYILACYTVVSEKRKYSGKGYDNCNCCQTGYAPNDKHPPPSITKAMKDIVDSHNCPNNANYTPVSGCVQHEECHDPIFW